MAWIEAHQDLPQHPKTKRLARMLNISVREAVGSLYMLWWWAMEYAEDGNLSEYEASDIADAVQWEGDPEKFLTSLIECGPGSKSGFIDKTEKGLFLHDWEEYGGHYLEMREKNRERIKKMRSEKKEACTERVRTPYVQGNITQHDNTQQYMTEQNTTEEKPTPPTHHPVDDESATLQKVIDCWNKKLGPLGFPGILKNTPAREKALRGRINMSSDREKIDWWKNLFEKISQSDFLKNSTKDRNWFSFDWILNENNLVKVLEGKYDNRTQQEQSPILSFDEILSKHSADNAIDADFQEVKSHD